MFRLFHFLAAICTVGSLSAAELHIGLSQSFARIEDALVKAKPGDTLLVHALPGGRAYEKVALLVRVTRLTIRAIPSTPGERVKLSGLGYDYSGDGRIPRAIVQFDAQAAGCTLEGFDISGAHNAWFNGAGVRINQANDILIANCEIHDNEMGIMSNGDARAVPATGSRQRIESCIIHHNGAPQEPGQNHNVYLGGTDVTLLHCDVYASKTGHNVKSRAHCTIVLFCHIHDAAARELDLVDDVGNTELPGSDALLLGNFIEKSPTNTANHTVIHFGQDSGKHDHNGTLFLFCNTIYTPFISPVIDLSAPHSSVMLTDNMISSRGAKQRNQVLVKNRTGSNDAMLARGKNNRFLGGFGAQGSLGISIPE